MSKDIVKIIDKIGINATLEALVDYCLMRSDEAILDGLDGLGWESMANSIDACRTAQTEAELDGEPDD